jgi:proteic killer suppression protein
MILSYGDERTLRFAEGSRIKAFDGSAHAAELKLDQLEAARTLGDLDLPENHFGRLKGDRKGQYSIRISDQWRIRFEWPRGSDGPTNVEIVNYY